MSLHIPDYKRNDHFSFLKEEFSDSYYNLTRAELFFDSAKKAERREDESMSVLSACSCIMTAIEKIEVKVHDTIATCSGPSPYRNSKQSQLNISYKIGALFLTRHKWHQETIANIIENEFKIPPDLAEPLIIKNLSALIRGLNAGRHGRTSSLLTSNHLYIFLHQCFSLVRMFFLVLYPKKQITKTYKLVPKEPWTEIHDLICFGYAQGVNAYINTHQNFPLLHGEITFLMLASYCNNYDFTNKQELQYGVQTLLLKADASVNAIDTKGWSAGAYSTLFCRVTMLRNLLNNGLDSETKNHDGDTMKDIATKANEQESYSEMLTCLENYEKNKAQAEAIKQAESTKQAESIPLEQFLKQKFGSPSS